MDGMDGRSKALGYETHLIEIDLLRTCSADQGHAVI